MYFEDWYPLDDAVYATTVKKTVEDFVAIEGAGNASMTTATAMFALRLTSASFVLLMLPRCSLATDLESLA